MDYIIIIAIILVFIIFKSISESNNRKKKLIQRLENEWGEFPDEEYTSEKFKSLECYYESTKDDNVDVDKITWNDLDMNSIFMMINNTSSAMGEEYLYAMLRKLCFNQEELSERNRLIHYFQENKEKRIQIQTLLSYMGKFKRVSIFEYINRADNIEPSSIWQHVLSGVGLLFSIICIPFNLALGGILTLIMIALNIGTYYSKKAKIEQYYDVFAYIVKMLESIKKLSVIDVPEISQYQEEFKKCYNDFKKFKKGAFLINSGKGMSGDITDIILDYIRMLFHIDLIKFESMRRVIDKNKSKFKLIFNNIGYIDSVIAIASFRKLIGTYSEPELFSDKAPFIEAETIYHPMISNPVTNSIKESSSVLITGSNASGKSTFIKTMAINAILAQTIYTTASTSYKSSYFKVYSSMALKDDLLNMESYYIVEIKSLKRIIDHIDNKIPVLCFVDEVLRGTNTLERIAASAQILNSMAVSNALCFAATHDIELTHILEKKFSNYHFQEQIKENEIVFDYMIYKGRAVSRNAIKLLGIMGYSKAIIDNASEAANEFLKTGQWKNFE